MRSRRDQHGAEPTFDEVVRAVAGRTGLDLTGCHRDRMLGAVRDWVQAGAARRHRSGAGVAVDPARWDDLVDRITVGETYFFRDPDQLDLARSVLQDASRRGRRPTRVWSAGCATGEEPYSLAIELDRHGLSDHCRILGTDLSRRAVEQGRTARYGRWSLRRCDDHQRAAHFDREGDRFRLRRRYLDAVELRWGNLTAGPPAVAAFDVVLCRNVLMYLRPDVLPVAVAALRDALDPGGWLLVGPSDPMPATAGLERVRTPHGVAYRRVPAGPPPPRPGSRPRADRTADPAATGREAPPAPPTAPGGTTDPERQLEDAISKDPLDASLRCLASTTHLQAGRPDAAAAAARAAVYLDRSLAAAHLVLARAEQRRGNLELAGRSFRNAANALTQPPPIGTGPVGDGPIPTAGPVARPLHRVAPWP